MARLVRPVLYSMLEAMDGIAASAHGKTIQDYRTNWMLRHSIQRGIEIVSEAARRIPEALRSKHPSIPWPRVLAIGNILRHEYHNISDTVIWNVVCDELPALRRIVTAMDAELEEEE